jgi:hypothetical protein
MSAKVVLVHRCRQFAGGRPLTCSCKMKITVSKAQGLIAKKKAAWRRDSRGVIDVGHIFLSPKRPFIRRPPSQSAQTIGSRHIFEAIGAKADPGDEPSESRAAYHRRRIELYGQMNHQVLIDLGTVPRTDEGVAI